MWRDERMTAILPNQSPPVDRSTDEYRNRVGNLSGTLGELTAVGCDGVVRPQSEQITSGLPVKQRGQLENPCEVT